METQTLLEIKEEKLFLEMMVKENEENFLLQKKTMQFVERPDNKDMHWYQFLVTVLLVKVIGYNPEKYGFFLQRTIVNNEHPVNVLYEFFEKNNKEFIL